MSHIDFFVDACPSTKFPGGLRAVNGTGTVETGSYSARPENADSAASNRLPADIHNAGAHSADGADRRSAIHLSGADLTSAHAAVR